MHFCQVNKLTSIYFHISKTSTKFTIKNAMLCIAITWWQVRMLQLRARAWGRKWEECQPQRKQHKQRILSLFKGGNVLLNTRFWWKRLGALNNQNLLVRMCYILGKIFMYVPIAKLHTQMAWCSKHRFYQLMTTSSCSISALAAQPLAQH